VQDKLRELKILLSEVNDLGSAGAVLSWDQTTYMPPGGGPARGRQMATQGRLAHDKFVDPAIGRLLDALRAYEESLPYDADDAALLRVTRRDYERALKVPSDFVAEIYRHQAASYDAWAQARPANDFPAVLPFLEKTLDLSRRYAQYFPGYEHIADPLIDDSDYGMKVSTIRPIFGELRRQLVPIVQAITAQPPADDSCLRLTYPEDKQLAFGSATVKQLGYDFQRGRQDKSHHPFTTSFSLGDVRITTRVRENDLSEALFSTIHEAGHAIYEQGIRQEYEGTPLASGTSSGVHESQSRLWENIVGRGRPFWQHFYPKLQAAFPCQLGQVPSDTFYRAINKVRRSLIRTDADEVTYNLHVIIRFGLELDLLEGNVAVRDLAEVWRARYQADLGIASPDDKDGVLQDVHWYAGFIGGSFQGYTLGNILGAQLYAAALRAQPSIPSGIAQGQFSSLHQWLVDNIYQHGRKFTAAEIVQRATGGPLSIDPYIAYLKAKYGELYSL
jgi:carboxypeptidase Taq